MPLLKLSVRESMKAHQLISGLAELFFMPFLPNFSHLMRIISPFCTKKLKVNHPCNIEGAYKIPKEVNPVAKDLISRMLQVDPRNRIKISEIKSHPWVTLQLPIYEKITDQFLITKT